MKKIILASASPRRRELLEQIGLEFEVIPSKAEEVITKTLPNEIVEELSKQKAEDVAKRMAEATCGYVSDAKRQGAAKKMSGQESECVTQVICENETETDREAAEVKCESEGDVKQETDGVIVIGSDTIVWQNGRVMGKPHSREEAKEMLLGLQGNTHSVFTGVTVIAKDGEKTESHTFSRETKVRVYPMTEAEIEQYIATGDPMDKAGAYGIQGQFAAWVEGIEGDYNSVVGLPVSALWQVLKELL